MIFLRKRNDILRSLVERKQRPTMERRSYQVHAIRFILIGDAFNKTRTIFININWKRQRNSLNARPAESTHEQNTRSMFLVS